MGVHAGHKSQGPSSEPGPVNHPPYERIRECWLASRDSGALRLRDFISSPQEPLHINCDRLVELLGDAQHDASEFGTWVFKQAAALLAEIEPDTSYIDNNDFTHTAKYLFVGACFTSPARSVLGDEVSRLIAEPLITRAVSFCETSQSLGTMPLLIKGVIASNVRAWAETGDIRSFWCKPQSLTSASFQGLLDHACDVEARKGEATPSKVSSRPMEMIHRFCAASSPSEFLLWALSQKSSLPLPEVAPSLRRLLAAALGEGARGYPFLAAELEKGGEIQPPKVARAVLEFRPGLYVDVFGTLVHHDGSPNLRLAHVVKDLMKRTPRVSVYLVSDSQDEEIERALSFLDELPTIIHKDKLEGCELECLIDNSEPGPQGFQAREYLSPDRAVEVAAKLLEGDLCLVTSKP
jgi:hypothetical protein